MNNSFPVSTGRMCVTSALLLCLLLGGCKAPPLHRGLTQTQVTTLKSAGFHETEEGFEFGSTGPILFDFDRYNLKPDVRRIVERIGRTLRSAGINGVRVYGYSDQEGADDYDFELSKRRAEVVAIELVDVGLDGKRIAVVGRGKRDPVGDNRTPAGRMQNRRAAIVVSPR
ncbi:MULTISPECIES: OmpA family protein [Burkholderia cepacia complex]|uniref:OmpA family protein n=1 Tax=Burkholderia cepacia complex TaxID=87882 RepID=UPI00064BC215|nr:MULTISPECIES: OmpA family protein [Burkholderia cepacia complex]AKM03253.1 membrane protein [Burkholderia pyrrocinia]GAU03491.1 integral membrane protein YfiB [Burkholderia stabilis]